MQPTNAGPAKIETPDPRAKSAVAVLKRVFKSVRPGIQFRLWDGTEGQVGSPDGSFTVIVRDRKSFARAFSAQSSKLMAEAYVENEMDIEGDLFACLRIANQLEYISFGWLDKLAIWRLVRRVGK